MEEGSARSSVSRRHPARTGLDPGSSGGFCSLAGLASRPAVNHPFMPPHEGMVERGSRFGNICLIPILGKRSDRHENNCSLDHSCFC